MIDIFLVTYPRPFGPSYDPEFNVVNDDGSITVTTLASITDLSEFREWCAEHGIIINPHPGGTIYGLDMPDEETAFHLRLRWA